MSKKGEAGLVGSTASREGAGEPRWRAGGEAWQVEWCLVYFCLWVRRWAWQGVTSHMGGQLLGRHKGRFQPPVLDVRWMDVHLAFPLYPRGLCCGGQLPRHANLWCF